MGQSQSYIKLSQIKEYERLLRQQYREITLAYYSTLLYRIIVITTKHTSHVEFRKCTHLFNNKVTHSWF